MQSSHAPNQGSPDAGSVSDSDRPRGNPSSLKPLFKDMRRMICLRNVGREGFVPRDLTRQDKILEAMAITLRECESEVQRLTAAVRERQQKFTKRASTSAKRESSAGLVVASRSPTPSRRSTDSPAATALLPDLSHTHTRLFLDSDIARAVFHPSLRVMASNDRFVMSPVFNAISRSDLLARKLSLYAFYDPSCAHYLKQTVSQLQLGDVVELQLVLTPTRPLTRALCITAIAYASFADLPTTTTLAVPMATDVAEYFNLVVTQCQLVDTPVHLTGQSRFLHHPGVEYIVRSSELKCLYRNGRALPLNVLLSSHSSAIFSQPLPIRTQSSLSSVSAPTSCLLPPPFGPLGSSLGASARTLTDLSHTADVSAPVMTVEPVTHHLLRNTAVVSTHHAVTDAAIQDVTSVVTVSPFDHTNPRSLILSSAAAASSSPRHHIPRSSSQPLDSYAPAEHASLLTPSVQNLSTAARSHAPNWSSLVLFPEASKEKTHSFSSMLSGAPSCMSPASVSISAPTDHQSRQQRQQQWQQPFAGFEAIARASVPSVYAPLPGGVPRENLMTFAFPQVTAVDRDSAGTYGMASVAAGDTSRSLSGSHGGGVSASAVSDGVLMKSCGGSTGAQLFDLLLSTWQPSEDMQESDFRALAASSTLAVL